MLNRLLTGILEIDIEDLKKVIQEIDSTLELSMKQRRRLSRKLGILGHSVLIVANMLKSEKSLPMRLITPELGHELYSDIVARGRKRRG